MKVSLLSLQADHGIRKMQGATGEQINKAGWDSIKTTLLFSLISNALKDSYLKGDAICFPQPHITLEKIKKNLLKSITQWISLDSKPRAKLGIRPHGFLCTCLFNEIISGSYASLHVQLLVVGREGGWGKGNQVTRTRPRWNNLNRYHELVHKEQIIGNSLTRSIERKNAPLVQ